MMKDYRHPALRQLKEQQVRFAPVEKRLGQLDRIEKLLTEITPSKKYPYQYVCFRITDFRTDANPNLMIEGTELEHDLQLFIRRATLAATLYGTAAWHHDRLADLLFE